MGHWWPWVTVDKTKEIVYIPRRRVLLAEFYVLANIQMLAVGVFTDKQLFPV